MGIRIDLIIHDAPHNTWIFL